MTEKRKDRDEGVSREIKRRGGKKRGKGLRLNI